MLQCSTKDFEVRCLLRAFENGVQGGSLPPPPKFWLQWKQNLPLQKAFDYLHTKNFPHRFLDLPTTLVLKVFSSRTTVMGVLVTKKLVSRFSHFMYSLIRKIIKPSTYSYLETVNNVIWQFKVQEETCFEIKRSSFYVEGRPICCVFLARQ